MFTLPFCYLFAFDLFITLKILIFQSSKPWDIPNAILLLQRLDSLVSNVEGWRIDFNKDVRKGPLGKTLSSSFEEHKKSISRTYRFSGPAPINDAIRSLFHTMDTSPVLLCEVSGR